jgi:hypothetical protein
MAVVKCTQLKGLADKSDYTCTLDALFPPQCARRRFTDIGNLQTAPPTSSSGPSTPPLPILAAPPTIPCQTNSPSVESDVVIIASCIPTLQPVLELILGKRNLSSYSNSRNKYKGSHQLHDYSYEASKPPRKTDTTITGVGSQESILQDNTHDGRRNGNGGDPLRAIRRTDDVTVEYERSPPVAGVEGRGSW